MERNMPYRKLALGALSLVLAFVPGTADRAHAAHRRCTGHNITNHGEVVRGAAIKADVEIKVGAGEWVELRPDERISLGYYCVPTNVSFKVTGSDRDTHICLNPPSTNTNLYNYIRNTELHVNITNVAMSAGTRRRLSTPDEKAFTRVWSGDWTLPANVGGEWLFAFEGEVDDVTCVTVLDGQDHSASDDPATNIALFEATLTVPVVRKIVAYRGTTALANSDDNASATNTGYACVGPITLKAYSNAEGTEQNFPINPPRWLILHSGPGGTIVTNLLSGATVDHSFTNGALYLIASRNCVPGSYMFLTAVKIEFKEHEPAIQNNYGWDDYTKTIGGVPWDCKAVGVGGEDKVRAIVTPAGARGVVTYKSHNEQIATVNPEQAAADELIVVKGVSPGSTSVRTFVNGRQCDAMFRAYVYPHRKARASVTLIRPEVGPPGGLSSWQCNWGNPLTQGEKNAIQGNLARIFRQAAIDVQVEAFNTVTNDLSPFVKWCPEDSKWYIEVTEASAFRDGCVTKFIMDNHSNMDVDINVFLISNNKTSAGIAQRPGRYSFVFVKNYTTVCHEVGHNLDLGHRHDDPANIMSYGTNRWRLRQPQWDALQNYVKEHLNNNQN